MTENVCAATVKSDLLFQSFFFYTKDLRIFIEVNGILADFGLLMDKTSDFMILGRRKL